MAPADRLVGPDKAVFTLARLARPQLLDGLLPAWPIVGMDHGFPARQAGQEEFWRPTRDPGRHRRQVTKRPLAARINLATDRSLTDEHRVALWTLIDSHEWFLRMVAKDYAAELERIDRELEIELSR